SGCSRAEANGGRRRADTALSGPDLTSRAHPSCGPALRGTAREDSAPVHPVHCRARTRPGWRRSSSLYPVHPPLGCAPSPDPARPTSTVAEPCGSALDLRRVQRGQLPKRQAVRRRVGTLPRLARPTSTAQSRAASNVGLCQHQVAIAIVREPRDARGPLATLVRPVGRAPPCLPPCPPTHPPPCSPPVVNRRAPSRPRGRSGVRRPGWSKEMPAPDYAVRESRHAGIRRVLAVTLAA